MLSLPALTNDIITSYTSLIIERVKKRRNNSVKKAVRDYYTDKRIKEILTDKPANILNHNSAFLNNFWPHKNETDFLSYLNALRTPVKSRTKDENDLIKLFDNTTKAVRNIFDYDAIISKSKKVAYRISSLLDRNTCTYCNRQYTLTVEEEDKRIIRPQFDHWYPKVQYPVLALSIYNLIPSCAICNSSIKSSTTFNTTDYVHPYINQDISTRYTYSYGKDGDFKNKVTIDTKDTSVFNTISAFKLEEVYRAHSEYELKDLIDLATKYSDNYIKKLISSFDGLHLTKEEVYRMIFGIEVNEAEFHKRPFSKFKNDIIKELLKK